MGCLVFSIYSKSHLQIMAVLLLPFQFGCLLFLLLVWSLWLGLPVPCWINKSGESRYPCLVPNLKWNIGSFCPLSMMLAVGLSYMAFIMLRYIPSIPSCVFSINGYWIYQMHFLHLLIWSHGLYPSFFVVHHVSRLVDIAPTLHPQNKSHLIMVCNLFNVLLNH